MLRIGIFFGGPAREREISFLGAKTTFRGLNRSLFEPVLIFIDGRGNFIHVSEAVLQAQTIRGFYPPKEFLGDTVFQIYEDSLTLNFTEEASMIASIGEKILPENFHQKIDFAFLAVHGPQLEDGAIQGLLEWYGVPYYGSGVMGSGIGIDKLSQNYLLDRTVGLDKAFCGLSRERWATENHAVLFEEIKATVGLPFVIKAPHQGSSIGVSFVKTDDVLAFEKAVGQAFFEVSLSAQTWTGFSRQEKIEYLQSITNLDEGIAFPLVLNEESILHPEILWQRLDTHFESGAETALLVSVNAEDDILFEGFVNGQEFSCGVIQDFDGSPIALPPTEVIKNEDIEVFDFKTKYLRNVTRKSIPIRASLAANETAQYQVEETFRYFRFGACSRIDGFLTADERVILHDPNTLPGMSPVSFIFKQMAEIGLNITDTLTYFIRFSIRERIRTGKRTTDLRASLRQLDTAIAQPHQRPLHKVVCLATDEGLATAREAYHAHTATHDTHLCFLHPEKGEIRLPFALLNKDTIEDVLLGLETPTHPLIVNTRKKAEKVVAFIKGTS